MTSIPPVAEEDASPELREAYAAIKQEYGQVLDFLGIMAHRPEVMQNWLSLFSSITMEGDVPQYYKQLAFYFASKLNGCGFCCSMHRAFAKKAGVSDEILEALPFYAQREDLDDKAKATLLYTDQVTRGSTGVGDAQIQAIRRYYTEAEVAELTLTICLANFDNRWSSAMQIVPDMPP